MKPVSSKRRSRVRRESARWKGEGTEEKKAGGRERRGAETRASATSSQTSRKFAGRGGVSIREKKVEDIPTPEAGASERLLEGARP
jgi:hypothetical protein